MLMYTTLLMISLIIYYLFICVKKISPDDFSTPPPGKET